MKWKFALEVAVGFIVWLIRCLLISWALLQIFKGMGVYPRPDLILAVHLLPALLLDLRPLNLLTRRFPGSRLVR